MNDKKLMVKKLYGKISNSTNNHVPTLKTREHMGYKIKNR